MQDFEGYLNYVDNISNVKPRGLALTLGLKNLTSVYN